MIDDYRNTKYCVELDKVSDGKKKVVELVKENHPQAVDMHPYVRKNDEKYKIEFMKAYNYKCAYCGVSVELVPKNLFEVDHFIYAKAPRFSGKKDAGYIENLILACHDCNHKKSSFEVEDEEYDKLYPDGEGIKKTFYRDELFYIRVSDNASTNQKIVEFYNKLQLGKEIHRLDYLLMSLIGLQRKCEDNNALYTSMGQIIDKLRTKRNMM